MKATINANGNLVFSCNIQIECNSKELTKGR